MEIDHFVLLPYRSDGVFGLPTSSSGNMDRVNLLLSSFLFFLLFFFFLFRETETEKEYRVTEFENKIARNGGFGVKRYEIEGTENRFFDSINEKA